jgi:hypothetical protein
VPALAVLINLHRDAQRFWQAVLDAVAGQQFGKLAGRTARIAFSIFLS